MLTNLNELMRTTFLNIPVGIMLIVLFSLYVLFLVYRIEPKKRGYITGRYEYGESMMRGSIIFVIILLVIFIVCYCLDIRDVDGNRPIGHIILLVVLVTFVHCYIYIMVIKEYFLMIKK